MKHLLLHILFLLTFNSYGQLCVPLYRGVDRQIVTPDNHLILIWTDFDGELMDMCYDDKKIRFIYTILSSDGKIITDTILYLNWSGMHYDFFDCKCTHNPDYKIDQLYNEVNSNKGTCPIYFPYFNGDGLILSYFLRGDRRNIYEISIKNNGEHNWILYNLDTLNIAQGAPNAHLIKTEMNKSLFFKSFLNDKYNQLKTPSQTRLSYDSITQSHSIKESDIRFVPLSKEPFTNYKAIGKNWEIFLDGSIIGNQSTRQPLIDLKGKILYATVFNNDEKSCPKGKDIFPFVYAIDIEKGKVLWQKKITFEALENSLER